jgi:hypothetical protein
MKHMVIKHIRNLFSVVSGVVVGSMIFFIVGVIANIMYPTPPELMDPATPEAVAQRVAYAPTGTWLMTIIGFALGAFFGVVIGAGVAKEKIVWVTSTIGLLLSF